jgi:hypothetical protein
MKPDLKLTITSVRGKFEMEFHEIREVPAFAGMTILGLE